MIVDWGSRQPLAPLLPDNARLRLVVAPLESEWNLARAYNLAAQVARGAVLLKVDSDTWLERAFLTSHPLPPGAFVAGDWRRAANENAEHLNGVVLVRRADFFATGGYDERLRGYGWDDTDLYSRLQHYRYEDRMHGDFETCLHRSTESSALNYKTFCMSEMKVM